MQSLHVSVVQCNNQGSRYVLHCLLNPECYLSYYKVRKSAVS